MANSFWLEEGSKVEFSKQIFLKTSIVQTKRCPDEVTLVRYIHSELPLKEMDKIRRHIGSCLYCFEAVSSVLEWEDQEILKDFNEYPKEIAEKVKSDIRRRRNSRIKGNKWLFLSGLCFAISFIVKGYFFQCLFAALIFGVRWAFDAGGKVAMIMVHGKDKNKEVGDGRSWIKRRGCKVE